MNHESNLLLTFVKSSVLTDELTPLEDDKHRNMFAKIFSDRWVNQRREGKIAENDFCNESEIAEFRSDAKRLYPEFLAKKFSDFPFLPYGNVFLGLLAKCAFRMSRRDPLRQLELARDDDEKRSIKDFEQIPFPACIKIASDNNSGKVSQLFGKLPFQVNQNNIRQLQRQTACKTAEKLIKL